MIFILLMAILYMEVRIIQISEIVNSFKFKNISILKNIYITNLTNTTKSKSSKCILERLLLIALCSLSLLLIKSDGEIHIWLLWIPVIDLLYNFEENDSPLLVNCLLIFVIFNTFNRVPMILIGLQLIYFMELLKSRREKINILGFSTHIIFFLISLSMRSVLKLSVIQDFLILLICIPVLFGIYILISKTIPKVNPIKKSKISWIMLITVSLTELMRL